MHVEMCRLEKLELSLRRLLSAFWLHSLNSCLQTDLLFFSFLVRTGVDIKQPLQNLSCFFSVKQTHRDKRCKEGKPLPWVQSHCQRARITHCSSRLLICLQLHPGKTKCECFKYAREHIHTHTHTPRGALITFLNQNITITFRDNGKNHI